MDIWGNSRIFARMKKKSKFAIMLASLMMTSCSSVTESVKESFVNNLIVEDRYKMILDGLQVTLLITLKLHINEHSGNLQRVLPAWTDEK